MKRKVERLIKERTMKQLWAPWRIKYILMDKEKRGCILCQKPKEDKDKQNLILFRGKTCFAILNLYPYNNGHIMIAPYKHISHLQKLNSKELQELMCVTKNMVLLLEKTLNPQGFNIGMNIGAVAGAGIADHLHLHIIPRWQGDTNFMPIINSTKVINQAIEETYRKLKENL